MKTIPKRIFYVWGVDDPKKRDVQVCLQTWRQYMPDFEIIEINESSLEYFNFQQELKDNAWFREVYKRKMWAYVSDYIRVKTLYENGGIYFDTDVSVVKSLEPFLEEPAFVGMQGNFLETTENYVEPAILGAQKGNLFLKNIVDFYNQDIWQLPIYSMPQIFKYFLQQNYQLYKFPPKAEQVPIKLRDITVYPERFFIPMRFGEKFNPQCVEKDTYTIHWFGASWHHPDTIYFLKNKHLPNFMQKMSKYQSYQAFFVQLFGCLPFLRINCGKEEVSASLFKFIPLFGFKKDWVFLFGVLPILKFRKGVVYLFSAVPLVRIKNKEKFGELK